MAMLPLHVNAVSKKIHIKDMVSDRYLHNHISIIVSEPYFGYYLHDFDHVIMQTPTKMKIFFRAEDKFRIDLWLDESELRYLSQFETVNFIYPQGLINSDSDDTFYSTLNVPELLRAIKTSEKALKKERDNKPENRLKDFFGIDR